jgi:hypothetical protein
VVSGSSGHSLPLQNHSLRGDKETEMNMSTYPSSSTSGQELSRLLTAAVVNKKFQKLLLTDPAIALASGFNGERFRLGSEEKDRVLSIHAQSLEDFASQLTDKRCYRTAGRSMRESRALSSAGLD